MSKPLASNARNNLFSPKKSKNFFTNVTCLRRSDARIAVRKRKEPLQSKAVRKRDLRSFVITAESTIAFLFNQKPAEPFFVANAMKQAVRELDSHKFYYQHVYEV